MKIKIENIITGVQLLCIVGLILSTGTFVRNGQVYDYRINMIDNRDDCYWQLPSYDEMLYKFWIPFEKYDKDCVDYRAELEAKRLAYLSYIKEQYGIDLTKGSTITFTAKSSILINETTGYRASSVVLYEVEP